jgi:hypothetical protein
MALPPNVEAATNTPNNVVTGQRRTEMRTRLVSMGFTVGVANQLIAGLTNQAVADAMAQHFRNLPRA